MFSRPMMIVTGIAALCIATCALSDTTATPVATTKAPTGLSLPSRGPATVGHMRVGATCPASGMVVPPPVFLEESVTSLNLTKPQKESLKLLLDKLNQDLSVLRQKSSDSTYALIVAVHSAKVDQAKVQTLTEAATKADADLLKAEIDAWIRIKSVMTPEQAAKVDEIVIGRFSGPAAPSAPSSTATALPALPNAASPSPAATTGSAHKP